MKKYVDGKVIIGNYFYLRLPNHIQANKDGYVAEHRMVVSDFLGRRLFKEEVIHHINGKTLDNRLKNLEIVDNVIHPHRHVILRHGAKPKKNNPLY